ncbi:hypothetical protein CPZ30_21225 [Paenibacillus lautus]|nr:hypothetical protein CPZ30_21225 [Paenibacillus lautus]
MLAFIRKVDSVAGIILGTQPEAVGSFARFADQLQLAGVVLVYIPDRGHEKNRSGSILASFRDLFHHQFHVEVAGVELGIILAEALRAAFAQVVEHGGDEVGIKQIIIVINECLGHPSHE